MAVAETRIFHLATAADWAAAEAAGTYRAPTLASEGFCHCSFAPQVAATAGRYFRGRTDLVLLVIRVAWLGARLTVEDTTGRGELFPHVYGPIHREAVEAAHPLRPGPDGEFVWPPGLGLA